jgi:hypothetical protein
MGRESCVPAQLSDLLFKPVTENWSSFRDFVCTFFSSHLFAFCSLYANSPIKTMKPNRILASTFHMIICQHTRIQSPVHVVLTCPYMLAACICVTLSRSRLKHCVTERAVCISWSCLTNDKTICAYPVRLSLSHQQYRKCDIRTILAHKNL